MENTEPTTTNGAAEPHEEMDAVNSVDSVAVETVGTGEVTGSGEEVHADEAVDSEKAVDTVEATKAVESADTDTVAAVDTLEAEEAPPAESVDIQKPTEHTECATTMAVETQTDNESIKELPAAQSENAGQEMCDAASKIQAAFRGHLMRQAFSRESSVDIDIQELTKTVAQELELDINDPELHKAATLIQATYRKHRARKASIAAE